MAVEKNPHEKKMKTTEIMEVITSNENSEGPSMEFDAEDGSITVDFSMVEEADPVEDLDYNNPEGFYRNLVEEVTEEELDEISRQVIESFEADVDSRAEWEQMFDSGLDLLGLKLEETDEPFEGACTAVHPLIIESAVTFQSKAIQELMPAGGPVKTQVLGKNTVEREEQANRVQVYMNYQTTELMPEYFEEMERMLFHLPIFGSAFKKTYYDAGLKRPVSEFVPIDQFVVSNYAASLRTADRYTHVLYRSPIQLEREIASGVYVASDKLAETPEKPELSPLRDKMNQVTGMSPSDSDYDGQYTLLEQHCYLDVESLNDDTDLQLPFIITVDKDTGAVLAIRRNYNPDDPQRLKKNFFTHYRFVPALGFYGIGYIHMLGNLTASATSALRSLLDAGQFATLPAGFKAKGVRVVGDNEPLRPAEFREVEATNVDLTKAIVPLPFKEPSQTLFAMLQYVGGIGQKFADSTEQVINDTASYGPVGTTMALLEASGKFFSAVHKRIHNSQKEELKILARINYESMPDEYPFEMAGDSIAVLKDDFDGRVDVIPVSDPNVPSAAHRMMMAQMALQMSQQAPAGMYDVEELHRTILKAGNIPNLDKILPSKPDPQPLDPVSDILAATKGMPIKAFIGQDHDSHIAVKMAYLQDPANGANPIMQRIVPLLSSNIQEHSVLKYQEQMNGTVEQLLQQQGSTISSVDKQDPKMIERAMMQAAQMVKTANEQAAKGPASPEERMVQMEARRLDLEERSVGIEEKKVNALMAKENAEAILQNRELDLKERQQALDAYVKGAENLAKLEESDKDRQQKALNEALKMLTDLAKHDDELDMRKGIEMLKDLREKAKMAQQTMQQGIKSNES